MVRLPSGASARFQHLATLGFCGTIGLGLLYSFISAIRSVYRTDFVAFYSAGTLVAHGRAGQLFNFASIGAAERALVYPLQIRGGVLPFVNAPFFALVLAPLSAVPYPIAFSIWLSLNTIVLGTALWWLFSRTSAPRPGLNLMGFAAALVACVSCLPVFIALAQGQSAIWTLGALALGIWAILEQREWTAGAGFALAMVKPQFVVPILAVLLWQRRLRVLGAFVVACSTLAAVSIALVGSRGMVEWMQALAGSSHWGANRGYSAGLNYGIPAFVDSLLPHAGAISAVLSAVGIAACSVALVLIWRRSGGDRANDGPRWAATILVGLLASPHLLIHDLSLLILALGLGWPALVRIGWSRWLPTALYLACLLAPAVSSLWRVQLPTIMIGITLIGMLQFECMRSAGVADEPVSPTIQGRAHGLAALAIPVHKVR